MKRGIYYSLKPGAALLGLLLSTGRLFGGDPTCATSCEPGCGTEPGCCTKVVFVPAPWKSGHKKHWWCPEEPPRGRIAESVATIFEAARTTPTNLQVTVRPAPNSAPDAVPNSAGDAEPNCQATAKRLTNLETDIRTVNDNVTRLHGSVQALVTALEKLNPQKTSAVPTTPGAPQSAHLSAANESSNSQ